MKGYSQTETNIIINFSSTYFKCSADILSSYGFRELIDSFIAELESNDDLLIDKLRDTTDNLEGDLIDIFKLLISFDIDKVKEMNLTYFKMLNDKSLVLEFVEKLYNYYRHYERYAIILNISNEKGIQNSNFIEETNNFTNLVLNTYRTVEKRFLSEELNVFRQLQAGINVGLVLCKKNYNFTGIYQKLNPINTIEKVILRPPFICYTKAKKRTGIFQDIGFNPLDKIVFNPDHWFLYPAYVGSSLVFIYFHRKFLNHGVSLANLFELAKVDNIDNNPEAIIIFGDTSSSYNKPGYYYDKSKETLIGYVPYDVEFDYFGYMKKMILTCYNLLQIKKGFLPIHGAMVSVTLKNKVTKNICFLGDSGAGKSESLEAFRIIAKKYMKSMKVIFDDMGTLRIENDDLKAYGTEIGAFVRMDDLDKGYAFKQLDRAIFLNPEGKNARLVVPISDLDTITRGYRVDYFLYANNYEDKGESIEFFKDKEAIKNIMINAKRKAKGTTGEKGLVSSFFANPFGPTQERDACLLIIDKYLDYMLTNNISVGQIFTKLAIPGKEFSGPQSAASHLLDLIIEGDK